MDLTAPAAVCGSVGVALIVATRRNHLLLARAAVGASTALTAHASSAPTELRPLLAALARTPAAREIATLLTPLGGALARRISPERDRQVQLVPTR